MLIRKLLSATFMVSSRLHSKKFTTFNNLRLLKYNPACINYTAQTLKMSTESVKAATFEQVRALKEDKNVLLIDVREPSELQESGTIPGSVNIPLGNLENDLKNLSEEEFQQKYNRLKPTQAFPIVFSCRSGKRSMMASEIALKLGFSNVCNYAGGWLDWEQNINTH